MEGKIKQGDSYALAVEIGAGEGALDVSGVEAVEFCIGPLRKVYPAEVSYENGAFRIPLSQEETFAFRAGSRVGFDVRVKYTGGSVQGIEPMKIDVIGSLSKEVL